MCSIGFMYFIGVDGASDAVTTKSAVLPSTVTVAL